MKEHYKTYKQLREQGYTIFEVIVVLAACVIIPLALFWGWLLIKLVLSAIGFLEANT